MKHRAFNLYVLIYYKHLQVGWLLNGLLIKHAVFKAFKNINMKMPYVLYLDLWYLNGKIYFLLSHHLKSNICVQNIH